MNVWIAQANMSTEKYVDRNDDAVETDGDDNDDDGDCETTR